MSPISHENFSASFLRNSRRILVWTPPEYDTSGEKRYPVLYVHDGASCLDSDQKWGGDKMGVDTAILQLSKGGQIHAPVVVAVEATDQRDREYSPAVLGMKYADFVVHDLKPFIDRTYRTVPDSGCTATLGFSLGGLISLFMVWRYPHVFGKAGCLSMCFYDYTHEEEELDITFTSLLQCSHFPSQAKLYFDYSPTEEDDDVSQRDAALKHRQLSDVLKKHGLAEPRDFTISVIEKIMLPNGTEGNAEHNIASVRARIDRPLKYLFA